MRGCMHDLGIIWLLSTTIVLKTSADMEMYRSRSQKIFPLCTNMIDQLNIILIMSTFAQVNEPPKSI